jgi:UDP-N-acetylglucosamine--N-acetylmuramyl-(pentapeptide) pyrophosphoryl-undecaprenol N-acetylglucosamine transferase
LEAQVEPFFQDMAAIYQKSHLALARAGALTISELTAAKLPAVLIPFAAAADDHQSLNASRLAQSGQAIKLSEEDFKGRAEEILAELLGASFRLAAMEKAGESEAPRAAAALRRMASLILDFLKGGGKVVPQT